MARGRHIEAQRVYSLFMNTSSANHDASIAVHLRSTCPCVSSTRPYCGYCLSYMLLFCAFRYANRAKNIKNKPKINEDPKDAMLRE